MNEQQSGAEQHGSAATGARPVSDALFLLALLYRHKILIIIGTLLPAIGVAVYMYNYVPSWYSSTVSFVPPRTNSSMIGGMLGNISSALKEIGLSRISGGSSGYSHLVILESRQVKDSIIARFDLVKRYDMQEATMTDVRKVFAENYVVAFEKEGYYTLTTWDTNPRMACEMANTALEIGNYVANELHQREALTNREMIEEHLRSIAANLKLATDSLARFSKKYKIFLPEEQGSAALNAIASIREETIKQELVLDMTKSLYGENDPMVRVQEDLVKRLREQQRKAESEPGFMGDFPLEEGADVAIEFTKLQADIEVYARMKAMLLPMLEQTLMDEQRSAPAMYVLDPAIPAEKKGRPMRSLYVVGTGFGAFVILSILILLVNRWRAVRREYPEIFRRPAA